MDIHHVLIHDTTWAFTSELILRSMFMFVLIIVFLRLTGKRGVRQLSIFEVAILLALGSIAGDPMFNQDLPLIQALIVMSVVIGLYRFTTWLMMKYQPLENLLEGKSLYIVENGELVMQHIELGQMSHDEFFSEMRQQGAEHLGQIRVGLLESDGKFSILFYSPDEVRYGLPLFPKAQHPIQSIEPDRHYACLHCGHIDQPEHAEAACPRCHFCKWTFAIKSQRQT